MVSKIVLFYLHENCELLFMYLLYSGVGEEEGETSSILALMRVPVISIIMLTLIVSALLWVALDPVLEPFVRKVRRFHLIHRLALNHKEYIFKNQGGPFFKIDRHNIDGSVSLYSLDVSGTAFPFI